MMSSLMRPPTLKTYPATLNPSVESCAGVCGGSAFSGVGAAGPSSTGAPLWALSELTAHRRTAGKTNLLITPPSGLLCVDVSGRFMMNGSAVSSRCSSKHLPREARRTNREQRLSSSVYRSADPTKDGGGQGGGVGAGA